VEVCFAPASHFSALSQSCRLLGVPVRTFGAGFGGFGSTFAKSVKQGSVDVSIRSLEVNYSKNGMKCALKFEVAQDYGAAEYSDDDY
jgi:hypothetical protein